MSVTIHSSVNRLTGFLQSGNDGALKSLAAIFSNSALLITVIRALLIASLLPSSVFIYYDNIFNRLIVSKASYYNQYDITYSFTKSLYIELA